MNNFLKKQKISYVLGIVMLVLSFINIISVPLVSYAEFNQQINYQGKLTNSSGVAVADGDYNINFWLLASSTAPTSTAVWSEARTGVNKVTITNGLFSVMLGEVSSLTGVDFNQTLYLGVEIGGTGTPAWDGEMSPRKILGAVPAAFVAETANTFAGLATTSFLRSDEVDTLEATSSSALLTLIQNGVGKVMSLFSGASEIFTVLNNGNVGIATSTPDSKLTVVGNSYLGGDLTIAGDLSIAGTLADSTNATGTTGQILSSTGTSTIWTSTSTLGLGNGTFLGLTDTPSSYTANRLIFTNSGATALTDSANLTFDGTNLGLGNQSYIAFGGTNYLYASSTNDSIVFGESAGATFNSDTRYNTAIGFEAGRYASTTNADYNNFIGYRAGAYNSNAYNNLFGVFSGYLNTGFYNNMMGYATGWFNVGSYNNLLGSYSGYYNTGSYNEMIGYETGMFAQATSSVIIGSRAFYGGTNFQAINNVALGYRAGYSAQTGASNNILLGYQAADNLTTGANNIVIGYNVDIASTTGSNQLNIGNLIFGTGIDGTGTTLSSGNIGIGTTTPSHKLTVIGNTYLNGSLNLTGALKDSTNATGTTGQILSSTGTSTIWTSTSTLGLGNGTFLGLTDTPSSYTANRLIFTNSGATALTDSANLTFDGTNLGLGNQSYIAFGGVNYLYASSTNNSIVFGESAGETFSSSTAYNVALGYFAGQNASTTGEYSNSIGHFAGYSNTGSENNIFGSSAGYANTGSYNNIFGSSSGYENTGLTNNIIGTSAGYSNTGSENNIFGSSAGYANTGSHNNILGLDAGYANTGSYNNIFGFSAGQANIGSYNEFIGSEAANNLQATSSVIVGSRAFYGSWGTFQAVNNTALGYRAGYAAQTGASNNILLGYQAADNLTTGANNIVIGYDVDIASTTGSNQLNIGNLIFGTGIDGTGTTLSSGNIGIGTTTPAARLAIEKLNFSGSGVAGLDQYFSFKNTVASAVQFANRSYIYATNTATTTMVGSIIRLEDSNLFGNTVRGLEVQTDRGTNTLGENTALSGFARTFGVRGVTSGDAGGVYEPAGIFAETLGTTQGNAIRGYSSSITTASLLKLFQASSTFNGVGLLMNFGNSGGSFSSTTASKFIDLQNAGTSMFTVGAYGKLTIGDGTTSNNAGIQVGYGGICVDNDGSCNASTTGRISAVSYHTGNSDLAETYFSNENLKAGEVVYIKEGLSIGRAEEISKDKIIGVVSTKPGLLLGFDDTSLKSGEKSYPIALKGRVPVRLSNENGEIKVGDELMLSSVAGVVMKATSTGKIVGLALEDFDGSRAYSDTYINQFGDDLVDPVFTPINHDLDPRINDGCYFGGGNASGEEPCVPLVSTTTDGQIAEAEAIARREAEEKALASLALIPSETVTLENGQSVKIGQVVMFVELRNRSLDEVGTEIMVALMAKASSTDDVTSESVWQRIVKLANNFVDGVLSIFTLKADRVEVKNELCVDGVCINADDLRQILETGNNNGGENNQSYEEETEEDTLDENIDESTEGEVNQIENNNIEEPINEETAEESEVPIEITPQDSESNSQPSEVLETTPETPEITVEEVTEEINEENN